VNGFFSTLGAESRRREDAGYEVIFCLEFDRSTEALERLEKKLKSYEDLQVASGHAYRICFCFGHPRRETGARRVLARATVPVATAAALGRYSGRTRRSGRRSATKASDCGSPSWPPCRSRQSLRSASQRPGHIGAELRSSKSA
jgi:hypothetical protein